ncbi:MAG: DUF6701 domain-containing protein [Burkholderiales bacterium]
MMLRQGARMLAWVYGVLLLLTYTSSFAAPGVAVTPTSGGTSISADNAGTTNWTSLTGPVLSENNPGGIGLGTLVLTIPSGFQLNTANPVTVSVACSGSGSNMITSSPAVLSGNTITSTVSQISSGGRTCIATFSGIQVRPTAFTPLASGVITESGTSTFSINPALTAAGYGQLTEVAGTNIAPTITKSFSPTSISVSSTSTLTITITNPNTKQIVGLAFTDAYPTNLQNAAAPALTNGCGGVATGAASAAALSLTGGSLAASASCTVTVKVTSATAASYGNPTSSMAVTATNAPSGSLAANAATLTVTAAVGSFDAVEVGASPHTNLYTKLTGVNFTVAILALDAANAVSSAYTGTVSLTLVDAATGGGVCASMTSLQALGSLTFIAADAGRKTTASINYAGAARNAKIKINDAALGITSCSFDTFAIRPTTLSITSNMTNTATTGVPSINAGANFTLTATGVAGYNGTPAIDNTKLAAHAGGANGTTTGVFPAATAATGIAQGTTFTYSEVGNFQFLAQGVYDNTFTVVDQPGGDCTNDFSNALVGGKYGCKFGSPATSFFGRFTPDNFVVSAASITNRNMVCVSSFTYMGEPIGLAFTLTAKNAAGNTTQNYTTASGFSKLNPAQPSYFNFVAKDTTLTSLRAFTINAITRANPGQVTTSVAHGFATGQKVYITGAGGMTQINGQSVTVTVLSATSFTVGIDTSAYSVYTSGGTVSRLSGLTSSGTWAAGSTTVAATVVLERAVNPDGPYSALNIAIAPRDDDGVALLSGSLNFDADTTVGNDSFSLGATETRFGRLNVSNAFGSELLDLSIPIQTQYYNSSGVYITNVADSCTTLAASNLAFTFVGATPNLVACETSITPTTTLYFTAGMASAVAPPTATPVPRLSKPGAGNNGIVVLTVNLGSASGNTCMAGATSAATGANLPWLQWKWTGTTYDQNPTARATFGVYKNADQFIYLRENF